MLAQALVQDETQATFEWILQSLKNLNCNITPQTIFTDGNPGMAVAIHNQLPNAKHRHCLFHISQNPAKYFAQKLGRVQYKKFLDQFYCACNSRCEELFESRWQQLRNNFSEYEWYLHRLYRSRHAWALVYTCTTFCASMNSTQRVESINGF